MSVTSIQEALGSELLRGQSTESLELRSSVVRVFISSTFSDMSRERDALMKVAYPKIQAFCQSLGLEFEVVDLRWGVCDAVAVDHMTTELCLQEIQSCKKVSAGPTFVTLLGNRYGYRPIPRLIPEDEFHLLLSKLARDQGGVRLLRKWFYKDENSIPPTYVLQPINIHLPHYLDTRPEFRLLHGKDVITWRHTEARILQLLRTAALQAENDGAMSTEQKQKFFKSVIEWEIEQGLLGMSKSDLNALLFVRELELPRLKKNDSPKGLSQFVDTTADDRLDVEAQDLLSALKSRIYSTCSRFLNLHCVELVKGEINPGCKEHVQYLEILCEQFVSQMKAKICRTGAPVGDGTRGSKWGWLLQEIAHHLALSSAECEVFCGMEGLLARICLNTWESMNSHHSPLVVFGPSGIGKTALLCKLAQEMRTVLGPKAVVVLRLLGTSPLSSEIDSVLKSICFQISAACNLPIPDLQTSSSHEHLVCFFHAILTTVSQNKESLVIILDALDQLSEANHAHKLHWLPKDLPPNVHIVISTQDFGLPLMEDLREMISEPEHFFSVEQLTPDQGRQIIDAYMCKLNRRLTSDQCDVVLGSFQPSGHPLLLKVALNTARQWFSYTPVSGLHLGSTVQEAISLYLQGLEEKHGNALVNCALGYIVSSRDGLSEAELQDLLSLDNEVQAHIYRPGLSPENNFIRLPPLLWTRLRRDLGEFLVERQINGIKMLWLYHRQLVEIVQERYLFAERRAQCHSALADYFLGCWSQGRFKPLFLPSLKKEVNADRRVPSQPLWFADGLANQRKLRELPYHLIHAGCWEKLCQEVIGSATWLCCKTVTCGVSSVIEDLNLCIKVHISPEAQLIRDTFLLLKPTLDCIDGQMDPSLFYTEIFARLHIFAEEYPSLIGRLCFQCQEWFASCPNPVLVPCYGFFEPPGGALKKTLDAFQKEITAMCICSERRLLVVGSEDGKMIAWSLDYLEVVHTLIGHTAGVRYVVAIDKGRRCLSSACDGTLRLWSLVNGRQLYCILEGAIHSNQRTTQIHVKEEMSIIYSSAGAQVTAWHLETAEFLFQVTGRGEVTSNLLGLLDGEIVTLSERGLIFYDSSTGSEKSRACLTTNQKWTPTCTLALQTAGKLIVGSKDGSLHLVSNDGTETITVLSSSVSFLSASHDEKLLCAGFENQVAVFNVQASSVERFLSMEAFQHEDRVLSATVQSQRRLLITGSADHTIWIWCLSTEELLDSFTGMGAPVTTLAVFENTIISASKNSKYLKLWQLDYSHKHRMKYGFPASSPLVVVSHDGDTVYFLKHGNNKEVVTWDCCKGAPTDTITVSSEVSCLEFAQKKKLLFCGLKTGTVLIYPVALNPETLCIPPPETLPMVRCMAISPMEDRLAVAYRDRICVFEVTARDSGPCVEGPLQKWPLPLLHSPTSAIALLPDFRLLKGTESGEVLLYDFKNASAANLDGHRTKITCVSVSNHAKHALIGSQDSVQRLWNLSPLTLNHTMEVKGLCFDGILCSAFSEDDQYVYTGSHDHTIKVWDVISGGLLVVQYVHASVTRILPNKDGFIAISQLGYVIKERFCCPSQVNPEYNPLQNTRAQYKVTSWMRSLETPSPTYKKDGKEEQEHRHIQSPRCKNKSSHTCGLL